MDKVDIKKKYKSIYAPSSKTPTIIEVPSMQYAVLKGTGNPNTSEAFQKSIEALYAVSYAISMSYKGQSFVIENFYNFVVPPLEGIWDMMEDKRNEPFSKDNFKWTIGIMQPEFVTKEVLNTAKEIAFAKKKNELINEIEMMEVSERLCCTFMHLGSYDDEPASFEKMQEFVKINGYKRVEKTHREIYLSDFRKVAPEKLKTVLQFKVEKL